MTGTDCGPSLRVLGWNVGVMENAKLKLYSRSRWVVRGRKEAFASQRSVLHPQEFDTLAVSPVLRRAVHLVYQERSPLNSQRRMLKKIS